MVPPLTPPPASQMVKPNGLWSRPSVPWAIGVRPNSPPQTTSVSSQQAAALQVLEQAGDRLVGGPGIVGMALLQVAVLVPAVVAQVLTEHLDEPHAALDQPPGDQALPAVGLGRRIVEAVELLRGCGFVRQIHQVGHGRLHAEGQLVVGDRASSLSSGPRAPSPRRSSVRIRSSFLRWSSSVARAGRGRPPAVRRAGTTSLDRSPAESRCRNNPSRPAESCRC